MSKEYPLLPPTLTPNITLKNPPINDSEPFLILGLDLALGCSGYCVMEYVDHKISSTSSQYVEDTKYIEHTSESPKINIVEVGHFITNREQSIGERLYYIQQSLQYVLNNYPAIRIVCKERGFSRFNNVTFLLNQALGVCLLTLYKNELEISGDYAPKSIKAVVSGSGNSTKEELQQSLSKYLNLSEGFEFANYDESDAVSVVLTYLIKQKIIQAPI
jgi:crossover junction endodeoxyribonuclease RuvC